MKPFALFLVIFSVMGTLALPLSGAHRVGEEQKSKSRVPLTFSGVQPFGAFKAGDPMPRSNSQGAAFTCTGCVDFFEKATGAIVEAILELGVVGGCSELCSYALSSEGEYFVAACTFLCLGVGLDEFSKILSESDLAPTWICARLDLCKTNECTKDCVSISKLTVTPTKGPQRTTFSIIAELNVTQATGVGYTVVEVQNPHYKGGVQFAVLNDGFPAGAKPHVSVSVTTNEMEWNWPAATYPVDVASCSYNCQDQHGTIFAQGKTSFVIT